MSEEVKEPIQEEAAGKKKKKQKVKKSLGREIVEWIVTILAALVIAMLIRTFIFEPVKVDGESMNDTLANGEIMFVTKFSYSTGYMNLPFITNDADETFCDCTKFAIGGNPARFDVVIARYPKRGDVNFVKRVVGLPGDTVEIREGYLYVNGEKYDEPYISDAYRNPNVTISYSFAARRVPAKGDVIEVKDGVVSLNGEPVSNDLIYHGVYDGTHGILITNGTLGIEDTTITGRTRRFIPVTENTTITIAEDNFFVMGDHRDNSNDSRSQGAITRTMIVGKVAQVLWPLGNFRPVPNGLNVSAE